MVPVRLNTGLVTTYLAPLPKNEQGMHSEQLSLLCVR